MLIGEWEPGCSDDLDRWCSKRMGSATSRMRGLGKDKYRSIGLAIHGTLHSRSFLASEAIGDMMKADEIDVNRGVREMEI